jgi:Tol biopolymer transport system component
MNTLGRTQIAARVVAIAGLLAMVGLPCAAKLLMAYGDGDIKVYDVETRRHTTLTEHPASDYAPSWSGNGRQIAFWSDRDGQADIYTMDADGANIRQRTRTPRREGAPVFSPNGRYVAYGGESDAQGDRDRIAVLDLYSGDERFVTTGAGLWDAWPSWLPDSERILFARRGKGVGLYQVDVDGGRDEEFMVRGYMPAMGRDGRLIAYIPRNFGQSEVYIYDTETGADTLVPMEIPVQTYLRTPRWADPGRLVVTDSGGNVHLVKIATGEHETLPLAGESVRAFDTAHPWDVSARGKKPFTWGWLKSLGGVRR